MVLGLKRSAIREPWSILLAVAFFAAVPVVLFFPALISGQLVFGYDLLYLIVPFHTEILRSLAAHQWPLWMPDVLGGMPGIASCNLQFTYPTDFISCLSGLPIQTMEGLDIVLHVALAGTGMFLFLRRLDRSFSASLLGGLFFAMSGSQISVLHGGYYNFLEGIAWVPWAFWAAHKGAQDRSFFAWGLCGLAFSMQILAQAAQLFAYTLPAVALFALSTARTRESAGGGGTGPGKPWILPLAQGLGVALGLCALLSAPQVWPTLQYLPLSARQGYTHIQFNSGSFALSQTLTWLVPGFFGWRQPTSEYFGMLPWALATVALVARWRDDTRVRWMAALALAAFFFAQKRWTPFYALFHGLPVVSGFRFWIRVLFLVTFAVCVLAAFGWDALRTERTRTTARRGAWIFLGVVLASVAAALALGPGHAGANLPAMDGPGFPAGLLASLVRNSAWTSLGFGAVLAVLLALWARPLNAGLALALALSFHFCDQEQVISRYIGFMPPRSAVGHPHFLQASPPTEGLEPWRIYEADSCFPNNALFQGYENLAGSESVPLRCYQRIQDALRARPLAFAKLMDERYYFVHSKTSSAEPGDSVSIYMDRGAFPRAWLVGRVRKVAGDGQAYQLLANPAFNPRVEVALTAGPGLDSAPPKGAITWLERSPQAFTLGVTTDKPAVLVLSNFWYPSWKATVDGRETPVLEADGGLQAISLPAGTVRVNFQFDPSLFNDALAACLAGVAGLIGLAWLP